MSIADSEHSSNQDSVGINCTGKIENIDLTGKQLTVHHRNFGLSDGMPRQEFDPIAQCRDMQMAITFAESFEGFDAQCIALWGYQSTQGLKKCWVAITLGGFRWGREHCHGKKISD